MLIDSHAHIYDEQYGENGALSIVNSMGSDGLEAIVTVGCDPESSVKCAELAESNERIFAAVGVHPYYPQTVTSRTIGVLRDLAACEKTVAIGEFGFDYHRDDFDKAAQNAAVVMQYDLARELRLPMVFHIRDGWGDFYEFSKNRDFPESGVMHCFSGSKESAEYCLAKGLYISFGGKLTYRNSKRLAEVAAAVPLDRVLIETDAPYLAPSKVFGQINYPKYVAYVRDKLAEIKGVSAQEIERATTENAKRLFFRMNRSSAANNG